MNTVELIEIFFKSYLVIFLYFNIWFLFALVKKDNGIVDIAWGFGFIVLSAFTLIYSEDLNITKLILNTMIWLWGGRLAIHITNRNWGKDEDFRYKNWRGEWGKLVYLRSYLQVFILQSLFLMVVGLPLVIVNTFATWNGIEWYIVLGVIIFTIGFLFEAVGDYQLSKFVYRKKHNLLNKVEGKIMKSGLWKYTRHPNYFGESVLWWGIALLAFGTDLWFLALISPIVINYLLLFVSGVPMLEKKYEGDKEYEEYKKKTSKFVPMPPKS